MLAANVNFIHIQMGTKNTLGYEKITSELTF